MLTVNNAFLEMYPTAHLGLLVMHDFENPPVSDELDRHKQILGRELRERFGGLQRKDLYNIEPLNHYAAFYKKFKKSYHVRRWLLTQTPG